MTVRYAAGVTNSIQIRLRNGDITDFDEQVREITSCVVIGRARDADIVLPDQEVSRRHAVIRPTPEGGWALEDLHSKHGTRLNGRRVEPGESVPLQPGDVAVIQPWSLVVGGSEHSRGTLVMASQSTGTIEDAVASPLLRERFDSIVAAVRRATSRLGDEESLGAMLESLLEASELDRAMVLRVEEQETRAIAIRARDRNDEVNPRSYSSTLLNAAMARETTVRIEEHSEMSGAESIIASGASEALARTIRIDGSGALALYADRRSTRGEDPELVAWFDAVASLCEVAIRMQQGRQAEADRAKLAADMAAARAVQELLLPDAEGRSGDLSWRSLAIPGVEIAGDLLQVRLVDQSLHVMLGDVSGKGARAGLVMAGAQACADTLLESGLGPGELVARLDEWAIRTTPMNVFLSLWCGRIEPDGTVRFVDAGHGHFLVHRADGRIESPPYERRLILGVERDETVESLLRLEPGDSLIVYSDGLVEEPESDEHRTLFGLPRLQAALTTHGPDPAAIHAALVAWCGREQLGDDLTILVVTRDA